MKSELSSKGPSFKKSSFICPNCHTFAQQNWLDVYVRWNPIGNDIVKGINLCYCSHCSLYTIWKNKELIDPVTGLAEPPNEDLPSDIRDLYNEANNVVNLSPKSACALLRLSLEKLFDNLLGPNKKSISQNIANLAKDGKLPEKISKSSEIIRIIGDGQLHNGIIDITGLDTKETALKLFSLINIIGTYLISNEKIVNELYSQLPPEEIEKIEKRYKKNT